MRFKNLPALLAAALLAAPAACFAENLIAADDPYQFGPFHVDISSYEGDPATGTKGGPQQCLAVKLLGTKGYIIPKQMIDIDPTKRYRLRFSIFSEGEARIEANGSCRDAGKQVVRLDEEHGWEYKLKSEDGKKTVVAPTGGWVPMEAVIGPGEEFEWPPEAVKAVLIIWICDSAPETVVYVKDLSAEEVP
jgi:hypothetical protein